MLRNNTGKFLIIKQEGEEIEVLEIHDTLATVGGSVRRLSGEYEMNMEDPEEENDVVFDFISPGESYEMV